MTHREARRKLGSRSTRRMGIAVVRLKSGSFRATSKPSVALLTWALVDGKPRPSGLVPAKARQDRESWKRRNKSREAVQNAYKLANPETSEGIANE